MTGFGRGTASGDGVKVAVELSSVNRKQLDVQVSIPRMLSALESRIYAEIHKVVARGRVTGQVVMSGTGTAASPAIRVDEALAKQYVSELRKAARKLELSNDLSTGLLLSLPQVIRFEEGVEDSTRMWPLVQRALERALRELQRMKRREGRVLQEDIEGQLEAMSRGVERIRNRAPRVLRQYRAALRERLEQAGLDTVLEDDRVLREIALFAERSDITEETTRLVSHIRQARKMLRTRAPAGKSLDFLAQELFREVNTVASKANDTGILQEVVRFKTELDRMREQVQNIE